MNQALILALLLVAACAIAFPILAGMGVNSPLPFADWGTQIYTFLSTKVATTLSTVCGLVGATGVSIASTAAIGYAYSQIKKQKAAITSWANNALTQKDSAITELTAETGALTSASKLKDEAFTQLNLTHSELTGKYQAAQTQIQGMQADLKTQTDQAQLLGKSASSLLQAKTPNNTMYVDPTNPNNKVIVVDKPKDPYVL